MWKSVITSPTIHMYKQPYTSISNIFFAWCRFTEDWTYLQYLRISLLPWRKIADVVSHPPQAWINSKFFLISWFIFWARFVTFINVIFLNFLCSDLKKICAISQFQKYNNNTKTVTGVLLQQYSNAESTIWVSASPSHWITVWPSFLR